MRGIRVGVTAARKAEQFAGTLRERGAEVVMGPMLSGDVPADDAEIVADTAAIIAARPQWVVASSGIGMALWLDAADRGGIGAELRDCLGAARCVARGAKPAGGLIRAGAQPVWVSPRETDADVAGWLEDHVLGVDTVAVQLHGGVTHAYRHLAGLGVDLLSVMPYRSGPPDDDRAARALIGEVVEGRIDLLTFTSPSAVRNLFSIAQQMGPDVHGAVRAQLAGGLAVASIGPVTSDALEMLGAVVTITPRRYRTGDLLRSIESWAANRDATPADLARTAGLRLRPTTMSVELGDLSITLGRREYDILATMLRASGAVFRPEELVARVWGHEAPSDARAVRHQVSRLRRKLSGTGVDIQTVRGVGYRLVAES